MPDSFSSRREPDWKRLRRHLWACFKDFQGIGALCTALKEESTGLRRGWVLFALILCFVLPLTFCTGEHWEARQNKATTAINQPVASAKFTVVLNLPNRTEHAHELQSGVHVLVAAGSVMQRELSIVLIATTTEHFSYEHEFRWTADASYDSPAMGHPLSELNAVRDIVLHFNQKIIPVGTVISAGELAMVVNNRIIVRFKIPAQKIEKVDQNNTVIVLTDVRSQVRRAIKQFSG